MQLSNSPLIDELRIAARIRELAKEIDEVYIDKDLLVLVVLKGAAFFASDLVKQLECSLNVDFIRANSYEGTESAGKVKFIYKPTAVLSGKNILLIEDILDTGHTCAAILAELDKDKPESIKICTLLNKEARRTMDIKADYTGFEIEDRFVVGYGMDYNEDFRNLPAIYTVEEE